MGVLVPTNTKLTHVFDSKVLVLVLVYYKLTLTPPFKHGHYAIHPRRPMVANPRTSRFSTNWPTSQKDNNL
jgi:hypothetical protein